MEEREEVCYVNVATFMKVATFTVVTWSNVIGKALEIENDSHFLDSHFPFSF